jgi:capping protein beta
VTNIWFYLQMSMTLAVADGHLVNMGKMIEEMEGKLRNSLDQVIVLHR